MKTRVLLFLVVLFFLAFPVSNAIATHAATTSGQDASGGSPYVTVDPKEVVFPLPKVTKDPVTHGYDWLTLDDCTYMTKPGHPALPVKVVVFKANLGYEVSGVTVETSTKALDGTYNVMPALRPSTMGHEGGLTDPDPVVYSSDEPYPGEWYSYRVGIGIDPVSMVRIKYVIVHLYPLQYTPALGKIIMLEKTTITVEYSGTPVEAGGSSTDLLIVTSPALESQALSFASYRDSTGFSTIVRTTDWMGSEYSGVDTQEKIRNGIKDLVASLGIKYVLIFGDADQVPVRLAYIPDGEGDGDPNADGTDVETDLYYADFDYSWDDNGDGKWGDPQHDQIDGIPDVYIGRLPVSTATEASNVLNKIIDYEQNVGESVSWFMRALLMGGRDPRHEYITDYIKNNFIWSNITAITLLETDGTLTGSNVKARIEEGYGLVNFAGHGNPHGWYLGPAGFYYDTDALGQTNDLKMAVIFTRSCSPSRFSDRDCLGEKFILNPNGGAVAFFGATRVSWSLRGSSTIYGLSGEIECGWWKALYDGETIAGKVWGQSASQYVHNHSPYTLWSGGRYLDWKIAAEFGSPFTDPTLKISVRFELGLKTTDWVGNVLESSVVKVTRSPSTLSGSDGWAYFSVTPGTHTVTVNWLGPEVSRTPVTIRTSSVTLDLKCHVYELIVEVKDLYGLAVSGAEVRILLPDDTEIASGTTDSAGRATFAQMPESDFKVDVSYQMIWTQTATETISFTAATTKVMRVTLSPLGLGVSVGVPLGIIALVVWVRRRREKAPPPYPPPPAYPPPTYPPAAPPPTPAVVYCPNCGAKLTPGAVYCLKCGRRVE